MNAPGFATVTFTVKNSGLVEGSTVAQVYIGEVNPSVERPEKELKGFQRVTLRPGESKTVTVNVNPRAFSLFDTKSGSWKAESGTCNVTVGDSSENDLLKTSLVLQSNVITPVSD
ncbi:MAG: fibronectin type III-like domain-contianing protein [Terracidiphilus sp.]|nr:fibronectin type III-like domain-contianing protein [Terracidiphilus sp.]